MNRVWAIVVAVVAFASLGLSVFAVLTDEGAASVQATEPVVVATPDYKSACLQGGGQWAYVTQSFASSIRLRVCGNAADECWACIPR